MSCPGEVYLVGVLEGCYKIGRSGNSDKRLLSYSPKLPVTLTIHHRITTDDAVWLENLLHAAFIHRRSGGEWFRLTADDIAHLKGIVAIHRDTRLPQWVDDLLTAHFPNGYTPRPVVTPTVRPEVVSVTPVATASISSDSEGESEKSAVETDGGVDEVEWPEPCHWFHAEAEWESDDGPVIRGALVENLASEGDCNVNFHSWSSTVLAVIDGRRVFRRMRWIDGCPALVSSINLEPVWFDRDRVKIEGIVVAWSEKK